MIKKILLLQTVLFLLMCIQVNGQKLVKKAEIQVENGEYLKAAQNYKTYLRDNPKDYFIVAKMADALAEAGELTEAEKWFRSIPTNSFETDPSVFIRHGNILKKLSQYDDALKVYESYKMFNAEVADHYLSSCRYAIQTMSGPQSYEIFVMPSNSSVSDFGLTFYKNMPVFSSFREDILLAETEKEMNLDILTSRKTFLYNSKKNKLGFIKSMDGYIQNIGPVSFSNNGLSCAIIESNTKESYNFVQYNKMSSLHMATVNDMGIITASKPFAYNEIGSSINAAHLAFDGTALYFSSDRPGGYGGFDIYVSYLNDGVWSLPDNLGSQINSEGNEITPFLDGSTLYFASDYHIGLGGFDIFKSAVENGVWSQPINMGLGINSPSDEYFPALNAQKEIYFTSNRLGGKGNNDIYKAMKLQSNEVVEEEYSFVPKAVSLEELAKDAMEHAVKAEESKPVLFKNEAEIEALAFELPEFDAKKVGHKSVEVDVAFEGAHRIALDNIIPNTEVFFIQLASMNSTKPNFSKFKPLLRYGNIYRMLNKQSVKIRLGYFTERKEAESVLQKVRANGFQDAFIAFEILNTAQMELILTGTDEEDFEDKGNFNSKNPEVEKSYRTGNKYKVRLASYEDPIWFDVNKIKDLGRIEQWTKGGWTIFILAGYNNIEEAKKAQIQASNRGFKSAEVVIDNGGILERLKQN